MGCQLSAMLPLDSFHDVQCGVYSGRMRYVDLQALLLAGRSAAFGRPNRSLFLSEDFGLSLPLKG